MKSTIPTLTILIFLFISMQGCVNQNYTKMKKQEIQVKKLTQTTKSWNGNILASYPKGQPEITILKITIPPHTKLPMHTHPVISGGIILKGELTVKTEDNQTKYFKAGDAVVEVVNTWHYGANNSDYPTEILAFYAGIKDIPLTIKK